MSSSLIASINSDNMCVSARVTTADAERVGYVGLVYTQYEYEDLIRNYEYLRVLKLPVNIKS